MNKVSRLLFLKSTGVLCIIALRSIKTVKKCLLSILLFVKRLLSLPFHCILSAENAHAWVSVHHIVYDILDVTTASIYCKLKDNTVTALIFC